MTYNYRYLLINTLMTPQSEILAHDKGGRM